MKAFPLIPLLEAAHLLGQSPSTRGANISDLARAGKIPDAIKPGRDWLVPKAWVEARLAAQQEAKAAGRLKCGGSRTLPPEMT